LRIARLLMVLSSVSPLFILWAIRGCSLVPGTWFYAFCGVMVALPNGLLFLRIRGAKKHKVKVELVIGRAEDHRDHLLVYLFAMLLPFYVVNLGEWRELAATLAALAFVVFLFWHLNLHYMNVFFAVFGYRVFTIEPPADGNPVTGKMSFVLITRRAAIVSGEKITAYRLSNTVYFEGAD